jgi:hypothetical protein
MRLLSTPLRVSIVLKDAEVPENRVLGPRLRGRMLRGGDLAEDSPFKCLEQILPERVIQHPRRREHPELPGEVGPEAQPLDHRSFQEAPLAADLLPGEGTALDQLPYRLLRYPQVRSDLGEGEDLRPR